MHTYCSLHRHRQELHSGRTASVCGGHCHSRGTAARRPAIATVAAVISVSTSQSRVQHREEEADRWQRAGPHRHRHAADPEPEADLVHAGPPGGVEPAEDPDGVAQRRVHEDGLHKTNRWKRGMRPFPSQWPCSCLGVVMHVSEMFARGRMGTPSRHPVSV